MANIIGGKIGASSAIVNDYVFKIEDIAGGHRLTAKRGSDVQTMDVLDGEKGIGVPEGGSAGDVLVKTADGAAWQANGAPVILWVNPSPSAEIDLDNGLTIPVDLTGLRLVQMLFRRSKTDSTLYSGFMQAGGEELKTTVLHDLPTIDSSNDYILKFELGSAYYSDGAFTCWGAETCTLKITSSGRPEGMSSFTGDEMIPYMIIGYR